LVYKRDKADEYTSSPQKVAQLDYWSSEISSLRSNECARTSFMHRVRIEGLDPDTQYSYEVNQNKYIFKSTFRTVMNADQPVRFVVLADMETEPESNGKKSVWNNPSNNSTRTYLVDQTLGLKENLRVIESRNPDFIAISGDLVESGNEQRDWDEFWRHFSGDFGILASKTPLFPAIGNHENYPGPDGGSSEYSRPYVDMAIQKYKTYFEPPSNGSKNQSHKERYYRIDYGPITLITLDTSDGLPDKSLSDTNWRMGPGLAPDFNPGSEQNNWLEKELLDAQQTSKFIFVQFHHAPYSVGPHGLPAGKGEDEDTQSGVPVRVLTELFKKYGVAAVFSGHDEMYEHSIVDGIHFFDIGIAGDGLRGPNLKKYPIEFIEKMNPYQTFTAHANAPEIWRHGNLIAGGKHYGHLEVNVFKNKEGEWITVIEPVYIFPKIEVETNNFSFERRIYDDVTTIYHRPYK